MTMLKRGGAIAVLSLAGLLGACDGYNEQATAPQQDLTPPDNSPGVETVTSLEEVSEQTQQLMGQTVTVTGEVEEIVGPGTYRLEEQGEIFGEDSILVVMASDPPQPIAEDQVVEVTGEVRQFIIAEFERDYNLTWDLEMQRQLEAEYEGRPVVISQVTRVVETE
ncbi:hypothetical protein [Lyngbya sp. CCY1209]|uniref:hypothetical protein n=1 Tax=Lyngbya sp. CCY1209 TaxID=2886103 RepID=UPI002D1FF24F|nr:hypothetical protein [Lyngbya sp. CCY1209]MEB3882641.1 hypothetical protein [Lyngbya sp. CCY1209]